MTVTSIREVRVQTCTCLLPYDHTHICLVCDGCGKKLEVVMGHAFGMHKQTWCSICCRNAETVQRVAGSVIQRERQTEGERCDQ